MSAFPIVGTQSVSEPQFTATVAVFVGAEVGPSPLLLERRSKRLLGGKVASSDKVNLSIKLSYLVIRFLNKDTFVGVTVTTSCMKGDSDSKVKLRKELAYQPHGDPIDEFPVAATTSKVDHLAG